MLEVPLESFAFDITLKNHKKFTLITNEQTVDGLLELDHSLLICNAEGKIYVSR